MSYFFNKYLNIEYMYIKLSFKAYSSFKLHDVTHGYDVRDITIYFGFYNE